MEGHQPAGTDPIDLQLPRGVGGSSRMPTTRANDATIDSTSNTFDRHQEFVASDSISWRQGKFSCLEMVLLDSQCEQSAKPLCEGLKKIEDNMNQDFRKSRLSNEDLELSDQALALLCKDEACAHVRSAEDGNGYQAWQALLRAPNSSECDKPFESLTGFQHSRHQTHASIFDNSTKKCGGVRERVNA